MAKPLELHRLETRVESVLPQSVFDLFCSILLIGVSLQLVCLNYKLLCIQFFVCGPNTISRVSSVWRRRQRRNKSLQQVFDTAVKFSLIGCGTGLMILDITETSLDGSLYRLFLLCSTAYLDPKVRSMISLRINKLVEIVPQTPANETSPREMGRR